ncbi:hypothetical protein AMAG_11265 [Allomyces macrogynus ATCC 38327]|uniref:Ribosome biogenesis protein SLX9 n=1 Tax=Allomyces macrogynus (strain ATCC 38327) TaxID=578462 RepID=A0A0L0SWC2_ALLM3|nr:hypothetical protein AMAG_11265 [Allomyces macrogynus ATCC 38327]|eukprot:KNE66771.1 hypothetical protein AMAG_11265 [Allomyces macrogynus ATCC 38327]
MPKAMSSRQPAPSTARASRAAASTGNSIGKKTAPKKEKLVQKREQWMDKLRTTKKARNTPKLAGKPLLSLATDLIHELKLAKTADEIVAKMMADAPESEPAGQAVPAKQLSRKARQKNVQAEAQRFQAVINHAAFQADPFATIQLHLQNTLQPGSQ